MKFLHKFLLKFLPYIFIWEILINFLSFFPFWMDPYFKPFIHYRAHYILFKLLMDKEQYMTHTRHWSAVFLSTFFVVFSILKSLLIYIVIPIRKFTWQSVYQIGYFHFPFDSSRSLKRHVSFLFRDLKRRFLIKHRGVEKMRKIKTPLKRTKEIRQYDRDNSLLRNL